MIDEMLSCGSPLRRAYALVSALIDVARGGEESFGRAKDHAIGYENRTISCPKPRLCPWR